MLSTFIEFVNSQTIRNQISLFNPKIVKSEDVRLPRGVAYHYLDKENEDLFPSRQNHYLSDIPKNKKVPVHHVTDLVAEQDILRIENKTLARDIAIWSRQKVKSFRTDNLLQTPNTDIQTLPVFNYNPVLTKFAYGTAGTSPYSQKENLYKTYWKTVQDATNAYPDGYQFVRVQIPNTLFTASKLESLLGLKKVQLARVLHSDALFCLYHLYLYLNHDTRSQSVMSFITEANSSRVMIELYFKGYSCIFKMSDLISLSAKSELPSKRKIADKQLQKLIVPLLFMIQNKITKLVNGEESDTPTDVLEKTDKAVSFRERMVDTTIDFDDDEESLPEETTLKDPSLRDLSELKTSVTSGKTDTQLETLTVDSINSYIDSANADLEELDLRNIDLNQVNLVSEMPEEEVSEEVSPLPAFDPSIKEEVLSDKTTESHFNAFVDYSKQTQSMSSADLRSIRHAFEKRKTLASPYDSSTLYDTAGTVSPSETIIDRSATQINTDNHLVSDTFKSELLFTADRQYLKTVFKKDVLGCVRHLEKAGIIIKDHSVETQRSSLGAYEIHKLTLKPYKGKESTVYFRLPVVNSEGEFTASGIKYKMKRQRQDNPIRKVSPIRVALTSNYSKLFISRTERMAYDTYGYMVKYVKEDYLEEGGTVKKVVPGNSYNNSKKLPNVYNYFSRELKEFSTDQYTFSFSPEAAEQTVKPDVLKDIQSNKTHKLLTYVGYRHSDKHILVVDETNKIYDYTDSMTLLGTIDELVGIPSEKIPRNFSVIKVLGDDIPLAVVMSYYIGMSKLLGVTDTQYELLPSNKQYKPSSDELVLKFQDYKLILKTETEEKKILFSGFMFYRDFIKTVPLSTLENKDIYLELLQFRNHGLIHIKEIDLLRNLFLDPITVDVLRHMNEPTDYLKLLLRANELLKDYSHPDINDPNYSRIRGLDRMPGLMYRALTESVRASKFRASGHGKVELDPYKVWNYITQDNTVKITEDANPISDVKEVEAGTFSGLDGISKTATPEAIRRFHKNDMGIISESTVDSSDVGLNFFLTPYAKIANLRGMVDQTAAIEKDKLLSTSALLTPFIENDDPKRVNFVSIQNGHTIMTAGYQQPLLRTGYEYLMPYKVGKLYCVTAKEEGLVESVNDKKITVRYKTGQLESFSLGMTYGRMEGSIYKHKNVTDLKPGQKFKKDDYITYNDGFFEKDWLNPSRLIMKFSKPATVAFVMNDEVYEDSSAVSPRLSNEMSTPYIQERIFVIDFSKNIIGLREEGSLVEPNDVLFTLVDGETDYTNLSDTSIELLKNVAALSPKAKMKGKIFKYEVKYNGELSDMSPSLKKFVSALDKELFASTEHSEEACTDNSVTSEYRSEGKNLLTGMLELKIFIETSISLAVGD